ncbi:MAG: hypothetical protein A4S12_12320 [Proteobacteria bacterium SG_bin5]|nr:hypothetical protein [Sphingomonas sp.]OQW38624.1 MAG: hypothetical protein A4S12_12320 [Proteobacteria bacterium SG_bin5]
MRAWPILSLVLLAACGGPDEATRNLDSLDAELADGNAQGNVRDPALTASLRDQIMVDPNLTGQSNRDAVRPARQPYSAPLPADKPVRRMTGETGSSELARSAPPPAKNCPACAARREAMTLAGLAERRGGGACARGVRYSARWATLLPADLPLYPDARVIEAAGNAQGNCQLRIVNFASGANVQALIDYYYTKATAAGYSAEHQADGDDHVLAGARGDAAYALFVTARADGGAEADLVVNNGR